MFVELAFLYVEENGVGITYFMVLKLRQVAAFITTIKSFYEDL